MKKTTRDRAGEGSFRENGTRTFPLMNILRSRRFKAQVAGFTLLEIMMAMAILAMIGIAIYQFTDTTLRASQFYVQTSEEESAYAGLRSLLMTQLAGLPTGMQGTLTGLKIRGKGGPRDALQMVCAPGNATLTPSAAGYYEMTLGVRETPRGSGKYALGMERAPYEDDDDDDDDNAAGPLKTANGLKPRDVRKSDWIKLLDGVTNLEIAYFDSRLNGWMDVWTDSALLPNLVRLRLSVGEGRPPYELVMRVPAGGLRHDALTNRSLPVTAPPLPGTTGGNIAPAPIQGSSRFTR